MVSHIIMNERDINGRGGKLICNLNIGINSS